MEDSNELISAEENFQKPLEVDFTKLTLKETLGKGSFGVVYKGFWSHENEKKVIALKVQENKPKDTHKKCLFEEEITIHYQLIHKNIVTLLAVCRMPDVSIMVLELMEGGDLVKHRSIGMSIERKIAISRDVTEGLDYLHKKGFVHRDLRTENILMHQNGTAKIADFGFARRLTDIKDLAVEEVCWKSCPPELMTESHRGPYTEKGDIWALAIVMSELVNEEPAYPGVRSKKSDEVDSLFKGIKKGQRATLIRNTPLNPLITQCWAQASEDRPSAEALLSMLWAISLDSNQTSSSVTPMFIEPKPKVPNQRSFSGTLFFRESKVLNIKNPDYISVNTEEPEGVVVTA